MVQAEFLETGRVDQRAAAVERIEARERRRVATAVQRRRDLARRGLGIRHEQVHERRLAHPRLAEQDRRMSGQVRHQLRARLVGRALDRQLEHVVAERAIGREALTRDRQRRLDVDLVQHDERLQFVRFGRDQRAAEQVLAEVRFGREHDQQLVEVRGEQLRLELVGAVQQVAPLADLDDHALIGRRMLVHDAVADRDLALLAARKHWSIGPPSSGATM
jgi:hypothetical protein